MHLPQRRRSIAPSPTAAPTALPSHRLPPSRIHSRTRLCDLDAHESSTAMPRTPSAESKREAQTLDGRNDPPQPPNAIDRSMWASEFTDEPLPREPSEWVVIPDAKDQSAPSSTTGSPQIPYSEASDPSGSLHSSDFKLSSAATSQAGDDPVDLEPDEVDDDGGLWSGGLRQSGAPSWTKQSSHNASAGFTSWQDPDASTSSVRTLQYASGYVPPRTGLLVGGTPPSEPKNEGPSPIALVFPVLEASGLSSSDPSLLHLSKDTLKGETSEGTQVDSQTPLLATTVDHNEYTYRSPNRGQSFLADPADPTRERDPGFAVNARQPEADVKPVHARLYGIPAARPIDQAWLESLARSRKELHLGPSAQPSDILSLSLASMPSSAGFMPFTDMGSPHRGDEKDAWQSLLQSWSMTDDQAAMLDAALPAEKDTGIGVRQFGIARRLLVQRRLNTPSEGLIQASDRAIFALPLLALGLLATFGSTSTSLLFEGSTPPLVPSHVKPVFTASSDTTMEAIYKALTMTPSRVDVAVYSSASAVAKSDKVRDRQSSLATAAAQPTVPSARTETLTKALSITPGAADKTLAVKSDYHPLAFMQSTLATATAGLQGRRRQRVPTTAGAGPYERMAVRPAQGPVDGPSPDCTSKGSANASLSVQPRGSWSSVLPNYGHVDIGALAVRMSSAWFHLVDWPKRLLATIFGRRPRDSDDQRGVLKDSLVKTGRVKEPFPDKNRRARRSAPVSGGANPAVFHEREITHRLLHQTQTELQLALYRLEAQYTQIRAQSDVLLASAQGASRRTIDQARRGLDNVLREAADAVERTTGVEIPLPKRIQRKKHQESSFGEKLMQVFHHVRLPCYIRLDRFR